LLRQSARTVRGIVLSAHKMAFGPAARATKDYATHLPILVGFGQHLRIRKVLELGCGDFSSRTFLNSNVFAEVAELKSLETDLAWLQKISTDLKSDTRFKPQFVSTSMAQGIEAIELDEFDLIFVDDSTSAEERRETIREIYRKKPVTCFVVIHDFEVPVYREAAKDFKYRYTFKSLTPQTGIVWNHDNGNLNALKKIDRTIKKFCRQYEPDDIESWKSAFEREL
jgi:hypothetical protein